MRKKVKEGKEGRKRGREEGGKKKRKSGEERGTHSRNTKRKITYVTAAKADTHPQSKKKGREGTHRQILGTGQGKHTVH